MSFQLQEISRELDRRGCLPPLGRCDGNPHRPLDNEVHEEHNARVDISTPIIRHQGLSVQPGTSGQATPQPGLPQDSGHSVPGHVKGKGKGKGKGKKKIIPTFAANDIENRCEDHEGNFQVPRRASNSNFSVVDLEDDDDERTTLVNENADGFIEDDYVPTQD